MFSCIDLATGPNKGHPTTPIERSAKPSHRKGIRSPKSQLVHSIVREVAGYAPYERRVMELLRNSKVSRYSCLSSIAIGRFLTLISRIQDKKARKLSKKRVRTSSFDYIPVARLPPHSNLTYHLSSSSEHSSARRESWRNLPLSSRSPVVPIKRTRFCQNFFARALTRSPSSRRAREGIGGGSARPSSGSTLFVSLCIYQLMRPNAQSSSHAYHSKYFEKLRARYH